MEPIADGIYDVYFSLVDEKGKHDWNNQALLIFKGSPYLLPPARTYSINMSEVPRDAYALKWNDIEPPVRFGAPYKIPKSISVLRPGRNQVIPPKGQTACIA
jgi:hypothetical protein